MLGFLATAPVAIPGIVLGVGLFLSYTRPPFVLYGTLWILLIAYVTIERRDGSRERIRARERAGGSFYSPRALRGGETAWIAAGDVKDAFGNLNGSESRSVRARGG